MALCPICQQPLPEGPVRHCPSCGTDLMSARGPEPEPAQEWPARGTAWDERQRLGFFTALVETTREVLSAPTAFFRTMAVAGGLGPAVLYGVIVGWLGVVAASFYQALFHSLVGSSLYEALLRLAMGPGAVSAGRPELAGWLQGWAGFVGQVIFGGVFVALGLVLTAAVLHLMLLILGGARNGFEATLRVVSFSQATSVVFLLPFCGQLVGTIWAIVLYVIGLAEAHQIGRGKALAAVLLPIVLVCCCCGAAFALLFMGAAGLSTWTR